MKYLKGLNNSIHIKIIINRKVNKTKSSPFSTITKKNAHSSSDSFFLHKSLFLVHIYIIWLVLFYSILFVRNYDYSLIFSAIISFNFLFLRLLLLLLLYKKNHDSWILLYWVLGFCGEKTLRVVGFLDGKFGGIWWFFEVGFSFKFD